MRPTFLFAIKNLPPRTPAPIPPKLTSSQDHLHPYPYQYCSNHIYPALSAAVMSKSSKAKNSMWLKQHYPRASGTRMVTASPLGVALCAVMVPPWSATARDAIARPSPEPPVVMLRAESTR